MLGQRLPARLVLYPQLACLASTCGMIFFQEEERFTWFGDDSGEVSVTIRYSSSQEEGGEPDAFASRLQLNEQLLFAQLEGKLFEQVLLKLVYLSLSMMLQPSESV